MKLWSLRAKLMGLILLAFLPVLALEITATREATRRADAEVAAEAMRLARLVASNQQMVFKSAQQLLMTLAQVDSLRTQVETPGCREFLRRLLMTNPLYANIGGIDAGGNVFCSGVILPKPVHVGRHPFFQEVATGKAGASGSYDEESELALKPTYILAYPVLDDGRRFLGAVFVAIDLQAASEANAKVTLPDGAVMYVFTRQRHLLLRYPADSAANKESGLPRLLPSIPPGSSEGTLSVTQNGVERLYVVERLTTEGTDDLYVAIGIDQQPAYAPYRAALMRQLLTVSAIAAAALATAWVLGSLFIVRPARHLVAVARAVSRGNLKTRSKLPPQTGEFGEIGGAFNQMADALEHRIDDLNKVQRELQEAHDELETRVERRAAQLKLARERLVDAIENLDAGFALFGPDERLVVANKTYRQMFLNCAEAIRPGIRFEDILREFVRTGGVVEGVSDWEAWIQMRLAGMRKADGTILEQKVNGRWLSVSNHRMRDGGTVSLRTDITERAEAHAALERAASELRRSNEELERFAYVASHDLQEPLRMVASYTQLLARRYGDKLDEPAKEFIAFAVDGAQRMQAFIQDLLLYSRVSTRGRPFERLEMGSLVARVLENLRLSISEKKAEIVVGALPTVKGDRLQLTQLFQNLVSNALKFSAERPLKIEISAARREGEWEFTVRDNGIGLDPADSERIFVIFQRLHTRQEYDGTGIGLAICKKIVERHGGRIWVESRKGEGAAFHFTLAEEIADPSET